MGIRSDVGVAFKQELWDQVKDNKVFSFLTEEGTLHDDEDEGVLFVFEDVKWYREDDDIVNLYAKLNELNEDDFLVVEACHDYPTSEEGDLGNWFDNPWNLHRSVRVELNVD